MKRAIVETDDAPVPIERGEAFTRLLVANQPRIYGFIYSLVADRAAADDVLQEVSTVLWRKFEDFEAGSNFNAWALKIARFSVLEWRRKQSRAPLPIDEETLTALADQAADMAESEIEPMREALHLCLAKLPDRQRDLLRARYFDDESVQSIATRWQRTRMAIYKMLRKTHTALLGCIESHA
jgi:RNA polymerase sigma-70 factor (ECF subfamily)